MRWPAIDTERTLGSVMVPSADTDQGGDPHVVADRFGRIFAWTREGRFANFLTKSHRTSMPACFTTMTAEAIEIPEIGEVVMMISKFSARTLA